MFRRLRDDDCFKDCRDALEAQWERYKRYCPDKHFATEIRHQCHQRVWEMYLACILLDSGLSLKKASPEGPDLCIDESPPIWIEAVSAKAGTGLDRVKTDEERRDRSIPHLEGSMVVDPPTEESIMLRFIQALMSKAIKIPRWRKRGLIGKHDPCIVAISLGDVDQGDYFDYREMPLYLKALFGIGDLFVSACSKEDHSGYLRSPEIKKVEGKHVSTRSFLDGGACEVSGVIFSNNKIDKLNKEGPSDLVLIHNPTALYPLEMSHLRLGKEWIVENMTLKCINHV
jgi:hypothetical protein